MDVNQKYKFDSGKFLLSCFVIKDYFIIDDNQKKNPKLNKKKKIILMLSKFLTKYFLFSA